MFVARPQKLKVIKSLLAAGADVDKAQDDGRTPLILFCQLGPLEVVEMLLDAGVDFLPY
jgi:ankyrin repeat protein